MTLETMIKKVNAYNEIAEVTGENKKALEVAQREKSLPFCCLWHTKSTSYARLRKRINDEFFYSLATALLTFDGFEFNKETELDGAIISITIVNA